eukprot:1157305-Pelagomonas_calceolata.AAC.19
MGVEQIGLGALPQRRLPDSELVCFEFSAGPEAGEGLPGERKVALGQGRAYEASAGGKRKKTTLAAEQ